MKIKTFVATFLLFLLILFSSVGVVSVYFTTSQMDMLQDKSAGQFQSILHTLTRDLTVMWGRDNWPHGAFSGAVEERVRGYARYYSRQNIHLNVINSYFVDIGQQEGGLHFAAYGQGWWAENITGPISRLWGSSPPPGVVPSRVYAIRAGSFLPSPFDNFWLEYTWDVTQEVASMREVQRILLVTAIVFSVVAAVALYFILSSIFKPLNVIATASRNIAGGQFGERIYVKGKNELAQVAVDFNKMAGRIESQMQSLEEEAKNKQQFVDNFAHEIRTPLTSIYGYAEYMQKVALDEEEVIDSAAYIMDESRHMKNIANSLLELATLREYEPVCTIIKVEDLFSDIIQSMHKSVHDSNVHLFCENDNCTIVGQEDLIKALLLNLCNNALKACGTSGGTIELKATSNKKEVTITVTDSGCGILEKDLKKIFEPFYRLDASRNRMLASGGVGLGLTLCKRIAQVHGAQIAITSEEGRGTSVGVTFTTPINNSK